MALIYRTTRVSLSVDRFIFANCKPGVFFGGGHVSPAINVRKLFLNGPIRASFCLFSSFSDSSNKHRYKFFSIH